MFSLFNLICHKRKSLLRLMIFLTFDLIIFGAFVRLSDSGLGCPDWPGCYGHVTPFQAAHHIENAQNLLPDGPVTWAKAWIEMIHRYAASFIGLLCIVTVIIFQFLYQQKQTKGSYLARAWILLVWVILQGLFGMWTVTEKLMPLVVTAHLLGGITLLLLMIDLEHRIQTEKTQQTNTKCNPWILLGLLLLYVQIFLGGWVSTNYATLACDQFPHCTEQALSMHQFSTGFLTGFELLRPLGLQTNGEMLPFDALTAIHLIHRLFAVLVVGYFILLLWFTRKQNDTKQQKWRGFLILVITTQLFTGIATVYWEAPLLLALSHTASATLFCVVVMKWWLASNQQTQTTR